MNTEDEDRRNFGIDLEILKKKQTKTLALKNTTS